MLGASPHVAEPTMKMDSAMMNRYLAAEQVAQLAVEWHHDGGRQDVRPWSPHCIWSTPPRSAHDGGKRGGRHRLGQRADEHGQQQAGEHGGHAARMLGFGHRSRARRPAAPTLRQARARGCAPPRRGPRRTWPRPRHGRSVAAVEGASKAAARPASSTVEVSGVVSGSSLSCTRARVRGRERRPVYAFHACSLSLRDPFQYGRGRADEHAAAAHGNRTVSRASRTRGKPANARTRPASRGGMLARNDGLAGRDAVLAEALPRRNANVSRETFVRHRPLSLPMRYAFCMRAKPVRYSARASSRIRGTRREGICSTKPSRNPRARNARSRAAPWDTASCAG